MPAANVNEYLAQVQSESMRDSLSDLRKIIKDALPEAEEGISYGIPTYKLQGFVASFAAFKKHCSFFPGHTAADFADQLKDFTVKKGTVQFTPDGPIPGDLVREMVEARAKENARGK